MSISIDFIFLFHIFWFSFWAFFCFVVTKGLLIVFFMFKCAADFLLWYLFISWRGFLKGFPFVYIFAKARYFCSFEYVAIQTTVAWFYLFLFLFFCFYFFLVNEQSGKELTFRIAFSVILFANVLQIMNTSKT